MEASRVAKGGLWLAVDIAAREIPSFVFFTILARLLPSQDIGIVAIATSICVVAQIFVLNGLPDALVQLPAVRSSHIRSAFSINVCIGIVLVAALLLLAWPLSWILERPNFQYILIGLLPIILLTSAAMPLVALLRRSMDYKKLTLRNFVAAMLAGSIAIGIAVLGGGVWALVVRQVAVSVVSLVVLLWIVPERPFPFGWEPDAVKDLRTVAVPVMVSSASSSAARRLDAFIVGLFMSDAQVGIYYMMARLIVTAQMLVQGSMAEVTFSALSRMQDNKLAMASAVRRSVRVTAFFGLFVYGGLAVVAHPLVLLLLGAKWEAVVSPLQTVAMFSTFGALTAVVVQSMIAANHARLGARLVTIMSVAQLVVVASVARYGVQAIATAIASVQVLAFVPVLLVCTKRIELSLAGVASELLPILGVGMAAVVVAVIYAGHDLALNVAYAALGFSMVMLGLGYIFLKQDIDMLRVPL